MDRAAFILYLFVLGTGIVFFGGVHTYVYTLMSLGVLAATVLVLMGAVRRDGEMGRVCLFIPKAAPNLFFLMMLGFLLFQLVPLPDVLLSRICPEAAVVGAKSLPAPACPGDSRPWLPLAPYAYPVRMSVVRFVVYGLFFFGLNRVLHSQKRIETAIFFLLIVGCFEALYGLFQAYSLSPKVLWAEKTGGRLSASGTYVNRNHFAGLMEMGLILAAGFAASLSSRGGRRSTVRPNVRRSPSFRARLMGYLSDEQHWDKRVFVLFAGVVMAVGLFFSASRGGILAGAAALLCLGVLLVLRRAHRKKGILFLILFLVASGYCLHVGVDHVISRFGSLTEGYQMRKPLVRKTMEMAEDYRLTGVGVGNFQYAYPRYQSVEYKKQYVRFAHNDWAQFLSEAGVVGTILLLGGMGRMAFGTIRFWRKRTDPFAVCLGVVPLSVLAAMAVHSFSDFNLHVPANFLALAAIMAVGDAALHLDRQHRHHRMVYGYHRLPLAGIKGMGALVIILGGIGMAGWWSVQHFMAEANCKTVPNSTLKRDEHPPVDKMVKAIGWDPSNAVYWYRLGERLGASSGGQAIEVNDLPNGPIRQIVQEPWRVLERAVRLNPFDARYHLRLGWEYAHRWQEPDYHSRWLPAADTSMDRAAYFGGVTNARLHVDLGNYWTMRSTNIQPTDPRHAEAWEKARLHYRKAQDIEGGEQKGQSAALKRMKKEIRNHVLNFYHDEEYVNQVILP